ncbi:MAG: prolyl oligopeptidase family serine peptidase [Candidatus Aminicenantes bacterium]|nr:prolyl oligopeptidase family serine peptidase [Candidatus Aminicenantes bacterium]
MSFRTNLSLRNLSRILATAAGVAASVFLLSGSNLFSQEGSTAGQESPTKPQAQRTLTPEQQEMAKLRQQIRDLQTKYFEMRAKLPDARAKTDMENKKKDDDLIGQLCQGAVDYQKISYASSVDGLPIPAYLFRPLAPRGPKGHPALVWIHGGVHSSFSSSTIPFIRQAVDRGYIVIAPDYRGSTGYGAAYYEAIDYGGYEIDDVMAAVDYLKASVPLVDMDRLGLIGWSHGGFITLHCLIRDQGKIFKCGYAGVPVTNLVFRLSYKGPDYQADYVTEKRIGGEVHEKRDIYIERSPVYHVDKIKVPVMVHVATNDQDVNFVEDQFMIYALQYHIPKLAETKIYVDPPGGHSFDRLVNKEKTAPQHTPAQRDSWNRIWTFLETNLKPYIAVDGKVVEGK